MHALEMQLCPLVQVLAQEPQLLGSILVSTQVSPHFVVPPEHTSVQVLATHVLPLVQAASHAPQFAGSCVRSTHLVPHFVRPPLQVTPH